MDEADPFCVRLSNKEFGAMASSCTEQPLAVQSQVQNVCGIQRHRAQAREDQNPIKLRLCLDVCGPFRQKGADPDHADYRFALVGAYVVPRINHEVSEGGPHSPEVSEGGPHSHEVSEGGPHSHEVSEGGPCGDRSGEPGVQIVGGDFEPDVEHDTGEGGGPLRAWTEGELVGDGEEPAISPEQERRLPKGMTDEEFSQVFSEVDGIQGYQVTHLSAPLRSRTTRDVLAAVQDLYLRLRALGYPIVRVHADRARELRCDPLKRWLLSRGTYTTYTEGQSPQSNGCAESAVRYCKTQTKRLLQARGFSRKLWPLALRYATWSQMQKQIYPDQALMPFGARVHVKKKTYGVGNRYDLDSRWGTGYYVGPNADVSGGSVGMMEKGNFITTCHVRPGLVDADKEVELEEYQAAFSVPSRRLRRKAMLEPGDHDRLQALPPPDEGTGDEDRVIYDPNHPAEEYARSVLKENVILPDYIESLVELLPTDGAKPKRFGEQAEEEMVWSSGAYVHGGIVGVSVNARKFPRTTRVFAEYLKTQCPGVQFNSMSIFKNIKAEKRKDAHNVGMNLAVPLTDFEGMDIVVDKNGEQTTLKVSEGPQQFDPHEEHYTNSLHQGNWCDTGRILYPGQC